MRLHRILCAGLMLCAVSMPAAFAQEPSTGIEACDTLVSRFQACISTRIQPPEREAMLNQLGLVREQLRQAVADVGGDPRERDAVEQSCRQQTGFLRGLLNARGCEF